MSGKAERKDYPVSMRIPEADLAIIDRAARLRGRSRTDFVREAAMQAAEEVVLQTLPIRMSPEGFQAFLDALSEPARPVSEMVDLLRRRAPWETPESGEY